LYFIVLDDKGFEGACSENDILQDERFLRKTGHRLSHFLVLRAPCKPLKVGKEISVHTSLDHNSS
jgi:hypothetical protein